MTRAIVYSPQAQIQIDDLYLWIAEVSGYPNRAESFTSAILDYRDTLAAFPFVGQARDDLRPGLRTIGFRRRVVIAFAITDEAIQILGIYYGGRDYGALLAPDARTCHGARFGPARRPRKRRPRARWLRAKRIRRS